MSSLVLRLTIRLIKEHENGRGLKNITFDMLINKN